MAKNNKMTENDVQKIWVKNVVILDWFPFLEGFVFRVLYLCPEHFFNHIDVKYNKMTRNDVRMVWVQKQVIMCWFVSFASFCAQ